MAKRPITHVLMIIDMSGSMWDLAGDVRGGYNAYLEGLAGNDIRYRVTTTVFDTEFISLNVATKLKDTPRLNSDNYFPRGSTALLDAVGKTISEFEAKTQLAEDERVLVVVQTDGLENASREFSAERIAEMVEARERTDRWLFVYLGAGKEAWGQGHAMGFWANYNSANSVTGTQARYAGASAMSATYAGGGSRAEAMSAAADTPGLVDEDDVRGEDSGS